MVVMAPNNKEALQRRERLLVARTRCLEQMSQAGRRAFEQQVDLPIRPQCRKDGAPSVAEYIEGHEMAPGSVVAPEIRNLIAEAHRLRKKAESKQDIKTALKGLDTALKAIQLYGVVTGEIRDQRSANVTVNVVATREEGVQTAADLLLDLASAGELVLLIGQLQKRLAELEPGEVLQPQLMAAPPPERKEEQEIG